MIDQENGVPWIRKHDDPSIPYAASANISYPHSLDDLIRICASDAPAFKAAGSHWALSEAAVSDGLFIETHDSYRGHAAMGATLYDVVPGCLTDEFLNLVMNAHEDPSEYLVHFESGKRIYQAYAELDWGDDDPKSLATLVMNKTGRATYRVPWAFSTLGSAGGQTVVGALSSGTHGGDWDRPSLADAVMAIHLVADGGTQYWIEPKRTPWWGTFAQLTDDAKLHALYDNRDPKKTAPLNIHRDDDLFNAALVSVGCFGAVYSVIVRVVKQYYLAEKRRLDDWDRVKYLIQDPTSELYGPIRFFGGRTDPSHYLEINVSAAPRENFKRHICSVTKRSTRPYDPKVDPGTGRDDRRGDRSADIDPSLQAFRFTNAGQNFPYSATKDAVFGTLCSSANVLDGAWNVVQAEVDNLIRTKTADVAGAIGGILSEGGGLGSPVLDGLIAALSALLPFLIPFFTALAAAIAAGAGDILSQPRLGASLNELKKILLRRGTDDLAAGGLFLWQALANLLFKANQGPNESVALSYAIMDRFDYRDRICNVNVDSLEVFFDASDPALAKFVDSLLAYEEWMETQGKSFIGYISIRVSGPTRALIGMQRWDMTASVEIGGLRDAEDNDEFIKRALFLCSPFGGILHWGQRNEAIKADIEEQFGDNLTKWRAALGTITSGGTKSRFGSKFAHDHGLEV